MKDVLTKRLIIKRNFRKTYLVVECFTNKLFLVKKNKNIRNYKVGEDFTHYFKYNGKLLFLSILEPLNEINVITK